MKNRIIHLILPYQELSRIGLFEDEYLEYIIFDLYEGVIKVGLGIRYVLDDMLYCISATIRDKNYVTYDKSIFGSHKLSDKNSQDNIEVVVETATKDSYGQLLTKNLAQDALSQKLSDYNKAGINDVLLTYYTLIKGNDEDVDTSINASISANYFSYTIKYLN